MKDYIIKISGEFERGDCKNCPIGYDKINEISIHCAETLICPLEEVEQGEWIELTEVELDGAKVGYKCSACGASITGHNIDNLEAVEHCFYCGIPMKGGK